MYYLFFSEYPFYVKDYKNYLNKLINDVLKTNNFNVNVYVKHNRGNITEKNIKNNNNKNIIISTNLEHTIIKQDFLKTVKCKNLEIGNIIDKNGNKYLIRIDKLDNLKDSDIIIDYSYTNIINVKSLELYKDFSKKHICISPAFFEKYHLKENRNINILTTFINVKHAREPSRQRRILLHKQLKSSKIKDLYKNINNLFGTNDLKNLYKKTKILINVRQTDFHDTLEEIRILPAIQMGVIVICEDAPLKEYLPYHDYIIWESFENIIEKAHEVYEKYDYYFNLIYGSNNKKDLNEIHQDNINILTNKFKSLNKS